MNQTSAASLTRSLAYAAEDEEVSLEPVPKGFSLKAALRAVGSLAFDAVGCILKYPLTAPRRLYEEGFMNAGLVPYLWAVMNAVISPIVVAYLTVATGTVAIPLLFGVWSLGGSCFYLIKGLAKVLVNAAGPTLTERYEAFLELEAPQRQWPAPARQKKKPA